MTRFTDHIDNFTSLTRISKRKARKVFKNGLAVYIIPCKCYPLNTRFPSGCWIKRNEDESNFDNVVNAFEYYNCISETGEYSAFYIPTCYIDRFSGERCFDGYYTDHYNHILTYDVNYDINGGF